MTLRLCIAPPIYKSATITMRSFNSLYAVALATLTLPVAFADVVFDSLPTVPRGWSYSREARPDDILKLRVSLQQQGMALFEQRIMEVASPSHARYGQHMSGDEVAAMLAPEQAAVHEVTDWLSTWNVTAEQTATPGHMVFSLTVSEASELFDTTFAWYRSDSSPTQESLRTLHYSVPVSVAEHINFIQPTTKFPSLRPQRSTISSVGGQDKTALFTTWKAAAGASALSIAPPAAVCNSVITPQCLLSLYNIHYAPNATNGTTTSYASFLEQYARYTDLTLFETEIAQYASGHSFNVTTFNGGLNDQTSTADATEANLDNQYMLSLTYPLPITEFSTGGRGPQVNDPNEPAGTQDNEPYLEFLNGILALPDSQLPQTLSVSYGDDEQTWPKAMAQQVCTMFGQLGARSVSVLFASGDSGPGAICEDNAGTTRRFVPAFPASCPYVTAVGATQNVGPEMAASFSGGGFSNYFAQPSYQSADVNAWISAHGAPFAAYYNASGRSYPDVSAQGVDFLVVSGGVTEPVDGTSASSPTFASVVALLNAARVQSGQTPLGFLNPWLYSQGYKGLNDIVKGGSVGCSSGNLTIPGAGFNATAGWDPVTGLGTPDFGKLLKLTSPSVCNTGGVLPNPVTGAC